MSHIDYLSFVLNVSLYEESAESGYYSPDTVYENIDFSIASFNYSSYYSSDYSSRLYLSVLLSVLQHCMTRPVVVKSRPCGLFGYRQSFMICNSSGEQIALSAFGGNGSGLYLSFTGKGCDSLNNNMLHSYIVAYDIPCKITRVDIAQDFFYSEYTVEYALDAYKKGEFSTGGRKPSARLIDDLGNDSGKTLYVGKSQNGKMLRCYEKGKQLKNCNSRWVRYELVLTSRDRVIPLDVMLDSNLDDFFRGGYDFLSGLDLSDSDSSSVEKIKTVRRTALNKIRHLIKYAKISYGKVLNTLKQELLLTDSQIFTILTRNDSLLSREQFKLSDRDLIL